MNKQRLPGEVTFMPLNRLSFLLHLLNNKAGLDLIQGRAVYQESHSQEKCDLIRKKFKQFGNEDIM